MVTVDGTISANGQYTSGEGGGSGGGVYVTCNTFAGNGGVVQANGNDGWGPGYGGGGRIAVVVADAAAQQLLAKPRVTLSAAKGRPSVAESWFDEGTIYLSDASLLDATWIPHTGQMWLGSAAWSVDSLTISHGWIRFPADGFRSCPS